MFRNHVLELSGRLGYRIMVHVGNVLESIQISCQKGPKIVVISTPSKNSMLLSPKFSPSWWYLILGAICISALCIHLWGVQVLLLAVLSQAGVRGTTALGHHTVICEVNGGIGALRGRPRGACRRCCAPPQGLWIERHTAWATARQADDQR